MADFTIRALDRHLDFDSLDFWDVIIIGAGPGGLAASLTTAHRGLTTLVVEAKPAAGGQPRFLYADKRIEDIPGFPDGITGEELSERTHRQAQAALVQFRFNEVLMDILDTSDSASGDPLREVVTSRGRYRCRKVIIACGLLHEPRRLPVLEPLGKRVHYKIPPIRDYEGRHVVVVGGGDSALDAAIMILAREGAVTMLVRGAELAGKIESARRVEELGGQVLLQRSIQGASLRDDHVYLELNEGEPLIADLIVAQIGFLASRETFERIQVLLKDDGSIAVDPYFETSRPGIFAVGDVHGDIKLITVAWAEGIQAAIYAFKEITSPYWIHEKRRTDRKLSIIRQKLPGADSGAS